ncbi:transposase [Xanthomonas axonopodis pv. martyniicola]|nr:transposase [Xanthomonas axonopodis pv. martyniicola]OOW94984.1 transposase [Xanthomonas campestris pv. vitiscarnosae]
MRRRACCPLPAKPDPHARPHFIERFNRTFREEVLDLNLFACLDDVREAAHWWMIDYNEARSHDSLGGMTPVEYRNKYAESSTFKVPA